MSSIASVIPSRRVLARAAQQNRLLKVNPLSVDEETPRITFPLLMPSNPVVPPVPGKSTLAHFPLLKIKPWVPVPSVIVPTTVPLSLIPAGCVPFAPGKSSVL
jgi:hypothetical protein